MSAVQEFFQESYRAMTESDLPDVMQIELDAYPFPWTETIFRDCLRHGYECWVVELDQRIIGYSILLNMVEECHLLNLCIDPKLQSRGFGRRLLLKMLDYAKANDAQCAFLEVRPSNQHAMCLYESEGFNETGIRKNYYPASNGREDAVIFAKEL